MSRDAGVRAESRGAPVAPVFLRLGSGQVLLRGPALVAVSRLVDAGLRAGQRRDGIDPPASLQALITELRAEAAEFDPMSANGRVAPSDVRNESDLQQSSSGWVSAEEACRVLGVSARQVRRLAPQLNGRKVGRTWQVERVRVELLAAERAVA